MIKEFKKIIGKQSYTAFLGLLKAIGPDARTHRISLVIAAMLRYALNNISEDYEDGTLSHALVTIEEEPYLVSEESEEYDLLLELIDELCNEAGMDNLRESARGDSYSIAESAIAEYTSWYNMPWEDYH